MVAVASAAGLAPAAPMVDIDCNPACHHNPQRWMSCARYVNAWRVTESWRLSEDRWLTAQPLRAEASA